MTAHSKRKKFRCIQCQDTGCSYCAEKQAKLEAAVVRAARRWGGFDNYTEPRYNDCVRQLTRAVNNLERFLKSSKGVK